MGYCETMCRLQTYLACFGWIVLAGISAWAGLAPISLRTESVVDPLGIDQQQPTLSWRIESAETNVVQTAWQIQVDGVWDSGKVVSDQSVAVRYAGPALLSGRRYAWRVGVWDNQGRCSDWSKPAYWTMGKLMPDAWSATWIGRSPTSAAPTVKPELSTASWIWTAEVGVDPRRNAPAGSRYFQREIRLPVEAKVTAAVAVFAADNQFKLAANGRELGRGQNWQEAEVIDLSLALHGGTNFIAVEAVNNPADGAITAAGLLGRIRIEMQGLPPMDIVTDETWFGKTAATADSHWAPVQVLGLLGRTGPWGSVSVKGAKAEENVWTCLCKEFSLPRKPASAIARIAVDSKYWLWINGKLAVFEGGLKRGPNPQDTYFDVVDLAPYLQRGDNTIAVLAWYWGKEGFSHKSSGQAGFLFEMNADTTKIISDATWKVLRHPAYGDTGEPHPNYRMPDENVHFDARLDLGDWTRPDYNSSAWPFAALFGQVPVAPWNKLVERPTPQWRISPLTEYENARELPRVSDGKPIIARLPHNITFSPYLKIKASAGLTIDMRTDNYKGGGEYNYRSEYVTKDGVQEFESLPYLNGHWLIYSIPAGVEILDLRYRESRYDTDWVGRFDCDDPFLDTLWLKARTTMNLNMRDSIQDPDRERAQWWGDVVILMNQIFQTCDGRAHALIRKAIDNLVDWQKPDGSLYSPVPAGSWDRELPLQMLASIGEKGFWNYYVQTGDKATIEHAYPAVKRYLTLWKLGADGLVTHRGGGWDWADWGENIDVPVIENAWLYQALQAASKMARLTGHDADISGYEEMRARIEANYNRIFWNGTEYRSPGYKGETDERGHAVAVVFGLAKPEQWPAIKSVFARQFHASPYMEKYVLESLFMMHAPDVALARMKTRYKKMVESPYTTLWEGWGIGAEGFGGGSYNHGWTGGPLTLMVEYIAGITPSEPGFTTYRVQPQMGPLRHVRAIVPTLKGNIDVEITHDPKQFSLTLNSPRGTRATVAIPCPVGGADAQVRVNGEPVGKNPGVRFLQRNGNDLCFEVLPGRWIFTCKEGSRP